jgi:hypothetical protein
MEQALYQQIVQAVLLVHAPDTPPQARQAASKFCEEFKKKDDSTSYAVYIFSVESDGT